MSAGVVISVGLTVLFLATPVVLLVWVRSATMFSGRTVVRYDGPHSPSEEVPADAEAGKLPEGRLSAEEEEAWEGLTKVSWNMPRQNG